MTDTQLSAELCALAAPKSGQGVCTCLFSRLRQGYAPERLRDALTCAMRRALHSLLNGGSCLSETLVIARRLTEGREYLQSKYPLRMAGQKLLLSWPGSGSWG